MMRKVELLREVFTSQGRKGSGHVEVTQGDFDSIQAVEKRDGVELMKVKRKAKSQ